MKTNSSLLFYLKKPKNYLKGAVPIYLRITVDGNLWKCPPAENVNRNFGTPMRVT
jgi:hypothetical protein